MPKDDVEDITFKMYSYLRKKRNVLLDRNMFFQRVQRTGENIDEYHMKLESLLSQCDYGDLMSKELREELLRDRIISGLNRSDVQEKLLSKPIESLTLEKTIKIIQASGLPKIGMTGSQSKMN